MSRHQHLFLLFFHVQVAGNVVPDGVVSYRGGDVDVVLWAMAVPAGVVAVDVSLVLFIFPVSLFLLLVLCRHDIVQP